MWCCGLIPLGLFLVAVPMLAAGRGPRPWLVSLACGWGLFLLFALINGPATLELLGEWPENIPVLIGLATLVAMSVGMGALVLWVRAAEERSPDRTRCRTCGYDLRASPERCPECGTPVRPGPEHI